MPADFAKTPSAGGVVVALDSPHMLCAGRRARLRRWLSCRRTHRGGGAALREPKPAIRMASIIYSVDQRTSLGLSPRGLRHEPSPAHLWLVRGHQGGVHVDDQRPARVGLVVGGVLTGQRPGPRAGLGPGGVDGGHSAAVESAARVSISCDTVGSEATGPNTCRCARSCPMSARQSPPIASDMARSSTILPGSWRASGRRHGDSAALSAASKPTVAAVRVNSTPRAPETTFLLYVPSEVVAVHQVRRRRRGGRSAPCAEPAR
jgi:hypothetical protein